MALALTSAGKPKEALNYIQSAIRLNPHYPSHYVLAHAMALFGAGELGRAAEVLGNGFRSNPDARALLPPLASTLARLGKRADAYQLLKPWKPNLDEPALQRLASTYIYPYHSGT